MNMILKIKFQWEDCRNWLVRKSWKESDGPKNLVCWIKSDWGGVEVVDEKRFEKEPRLSEVKEFMKECYKTIGV